jgi:hypothetical protein
MKTEPLITDPRYTCKGNGWVRVNAVDRENCPGCVDCQAKVAEKTMLYIWDWQGGGYNSCRADSIEEATAKAVAMGKPTPGGMTVTLIPVNVRPDRKARS